MSKAKVKDPDNLTQKPIKAWHAIFIESLSKFGNVKAACRAANISRETAYHDRRRIKSFRKQWKIAIEESIDDLEFEARRRAIRGVRNPKFYEGGVCGYVREYSDALMQFLLKAHRPNKYRDPSQFNHPETATTTQPIVIRYEDADAGNNAQAPQQTAPVPTKQ